MYLVEYLSLGMFIIFAVALSSIIFGLSYILAEQKNDREKISAYECGFDAYGNAREAFNVHFYLVSILFIIFDLEVVVLFPWALRLFNQSFFGFFIMVFFLVLLTVGFFYEWVKGALEWD